MIANLHTIKLHPPSTPAKQVPRPHLNQRLHDGLKSGRRLTLISAPAGFGKTNCIATWINELDYPIAWLSLDPADDDPGRFFTYLIAALQKVDKKTGQEIEGVLHAGQLPPEEIISATLSNDILNSKTKFLLVLDDFQVIQDQFILQVLKNLVIHLPDPLHLVLLTREEPPLPLARLRANNRMTEIRAKDLRFTHNDIECFLNEVMELSLSQEDINALESKTEGWIAGLQLAGLSIQDRATPSDFITTLNGSHRYILSYLTEEVLNRQSKDVQTFLLQTSILDRLNGDLCNAVTQRTDSHSLLEKLFNANLFLIPLDNEQRWYRYHQLFVDMLRALQNSRQKDETTQLHQRAGHWYTQRGMVSEAIQHALTAEAYATAVQLIENHAMDMLMQWHLKTVEGWMQAIPSEWLSQSPEANLAFGWMHLMRGDFTQATPYLQRLGAIFPNLPADKDPALEAKWLALQAMLLNAQGMSTESLNLCNQALEIAPKGNDHVRSMIYLALAGVYQDKRDYKRAIEAFQMLIQLGQTMGNSVYEMMGISGLGLLMIEQGQYKSAFEITSQGIERIKRSGSLPPISTAVYGELGVIHYQWHQLEQAHNYFQRAIQVSTLSGYSDAKLYYGVVLSRLFQIQGDLTTAAHEIHQAVELMQTEAPAAVREEVIAQQVRVYLAQDNLTAAELTLKDQGFSFSNTVYFPDLASTQNNSARSDGLLYISALRILLHRVKTTPKSADLNPGFNLASRLIDDALQHQLIPFAIEALLIRAQLHIIPEHSRADYIHALELGQPEGFITIFLEEGPPVARALENLRVQNQLGNIKQEYIEKILAAFPKGGQTASTITTNDLIESLSKRELEVLQLIGEGYSNQEIAERMVVTLHTIKKHSSNIYSKLGVNSRTQAVAQARRLKLL